MATLEVRGVGQEQSSSAKTCCICGIDITNAKRQKDAGGRYWCAPCIAIDTREKPPAPNEICPDCGVTVKKLVKSDEERVCESCLQLRVTEREQCERRRDLVTDDPEKEIRHRIRQLIGFIVVFIGLAVFRCVRIGFPPPFLFYDYGLAGITVLVLLAIAGLYVAIAVRKRARLRGYDRMLYDVTNAVLALAEQHHVQGVIERTEPLRRQVERALKRVEAAALQNVDGADGIVTALKTKCNPNRLIAFLKAQKPGTSDLCARNREIEIIAYLNGDWDVAMEAVVAVLLRSKHDIDALSRQGQIYFIQKHLDDAKKNYAKVIRIAHERKDQAEMADALSNLAVLHQMLDEFDDAAKRHSQALTIYLKLEREDRQADCYGNLGLIHFRRGQESQAEEMLRKAVAIYKRIDRSEGLAVCYGALGLFVYQKEYGDLREAEKLLNHAVTLNDRLGRFGAVAAAYGNLGLVRAKRNDFKSARDCLMKAMSIYQRLNRQSMVTRVQGMLNTLTANSGR